MTEEEAIKRHPLGLPEGSVRAVLALSIFGTVLYLLLQNREIEQGLWMLTYTILGYYYTMRKSSAEEMTNTSAAAAAPLHLPRGTVRWLLFLMYLASVVWLIRFHEQDIAQIVDHKAFFPLCSITSFFCGLIIQQLTPRQWKDGSGKLERVTQDARGLFALISAGCIVLLSLLPDVIPNQRKTLRSALLYVFFYFGNR